MPVGLRGDAQSGQAGIPDERDDVVGEGCIRMTDSWANPARLLGSDLHLEPAGAGGRRSALTRALQEAVRDGRLGAGTLLPPYRSPLPHRSGGPALEDRGPTR